jgi:hypothetical protein
MCSLHKPVFACVPACGASPKRSTVTSYREDRSRGRFIVFFVDCGFAQMESSALELQLLRESASKHLEAQ